MKTLPDYLAPGLDIVSVGLNPSLRSVEAGFYFAHPRNRFWRALAGSGLAPDLPPPGPAAVQALFRRYRVGFTDVVKRPTAGAGELRAGDFRRGAPLLARKLRRYRSAIVWFHGKVAYRSFVRHGAGGVQGPGPVRIEWGVQPARLGSSLVFVTPNPSPANAAFSLEELRRRYTGLRELRDRIRRDDA